MLLKAGIFLILLGFLAAIYTGNLLRDSSRITKRFDELQQKAATGQQLTNEEAGELGYFKFNHFIFIAWKYVVGIGCLLAVLSFFLT